MERNSLDRCRNSYFASAPARRYPGVKGEDGWLSCCQRSEFGFGNSFFRWDCPDRRERFHLGNWQRVSCAEPTANVIEKSSRHRRINMLFCLSFSGFIGQRLISSLWQTRSTWVMPGMEKRRLLMSWFLCFARSSISRDSSYMYSTSSGP